MRGIARMWRERWVAIGRDVMSSGDSQVPWTDEQWALVRQAVQKEASRSRVAATFLPLFGPLAGDADFVKSEELKYDRQPASSVEAGAPDAVAGPRRCPSTTRRPFR